MSFSFSFAGDDIEEDTSTPQGAPSASPPTASATPTASSAFPVKGKPLLPPAHHDLSQMLSSLPSKIAYSLLDVDLDGTASVQIPRRELWDVRVQLMAEEDGEEDGEGAAPGLGSHDVKTGIYEGGFKSWESSVDLVKVLAAEDFPGALTGGPFRIVEVSGQRYDSIGSCTYSYCEPIRSSTNSSSPTVGMRHCTTFARTFPVGTRAEGFGAWPDSPVPYSCRLQPQCPSARYVAKLPAGMGSAPATAR